MKKKSEKLNLFLFLFIIIFVPNVSYSILPNTQPLGALDKAIAEDKKSKDSKTLGSPAKDTKKPQSSKPDLKTAPTAPPPQDIPPVVAPVPIKIPKVRIPELQVDDLLKQDYTINRLPEEYYNQPFNEQNSHLPPVYFESYYAQLAFNAVEKEHLDALRYLIDKYKIEKKLDSDGNTLLIHAANLSRYNAARLLIAKKINIDATNNYNMTALHIAAIKNDFEMAKILLSMNADFTIQDENGNMPIDYTIDNENSEMTHLFEEYYISASEKKPVVTRKKTSKTHAKHKTSRKANTKSQIKSSK